MKFTIIVMTLCLFSLSAYAADELCQGLADHSQNLTCLDQQYKEFNQQLVKLEATALSQAKEDDQIAPIYENEKALQSSIKTFKAYREAECIRQNALTLSGTTAGGMAQLTCEIEMTKTRLTKLKLQESR